MATASKTIVLIHGLFVNPKSWEAWKRHFEALGYTVHTPANPFHAGDPKALRKNIDPGLRTTRFRDLLANLVDFIDKLPEKPILIGHSLGGFAVQKLINMGKGVAGIAIDSAPPKGILSFEWSFIKSNAPVLNPFKGSAPFVPTPEWVHYTFTNHLTLEETKAEFENYFVPEGRNVARSLLGQDGKIDFKKAHAPLFMIAGEKDHIIPASMNRKNFKAYTHPTSRRDFKEYPGRTHYLVAQPGWQEIANDIHTWIQSL